MTKPKKVRIRVSFEYDLYDALFRGISKERRLMRGAMVLNIQAPLKHLKVERVPEKP